LLVPKFGPRCLDWRVDCDVLYLLVREAGKEEEVVHPVGAGRLEHRAPDQLQLLQKQYTI
jgi:hypothetical protein